MRKLLWPALALLSLALPLQPGCNKQASQDTNDGGQSVSRQPRGQAALGPETSPVAIDMSQGWCGGHGVPESVCTRCNSALIAEFKKAGDWCAEHGLPESQCTLCHPEVKAKWAALNPAGGAKAKKADAASEAGGDPALGQPSAAPAGPERSAVPVDMSKGWCGGHGVPESVCTRCDDSLIPRFQEAGDWCAEHGLPESQCVKCHPEVRAMWAALDPENRKPEPPPTRGANGSLRPANDPLCPVEQTLVRFRDRTIAERAGIETEPATHRRMAASIAAPAEVEFDRTKLAHVTPRAAGMVRRIAVALGDTVEAGDVLAIVESAELGEAKSRYLEALGAHELAEADLERVQTVYAGIQKALAAVGADATAEQARAALAGVPVGEAKSTLLKAHAELELARASLAREQRLVESSVGTRQALEGAQTALAVADAAFQAARESATFAAERDRLAAERAARAARAALDAAGRKLHLLGLSREDMGALAEGQDADLSAYALRAPVGGRVIEVKAAVGESVGPEHELAVVADLTTMWLLIDVHEREIPMLRRGQPVLFAADGVEGLAVEGAVTWVAARVNDQTRTVRVQAELPNELGLLRAGLFGRARIGLRENEPVLTVPAAAVQTDGCCQLVFVQQADDVFAPRKVVVGARAGGQVEVIRGLAEGERVATAGSFLLKTEILKGNIGAGCCEVEPGR